MATTHPTVPQINLLPDVKINLLKARMQRNVMISVSVLVTVVCGLIMFILTSTLTTLAVVKTVADGKIKDYSTKITKEQKTGELNEYMTIQNQLEQISKLKKTQEQFSLLFDYLAKLNPTGSNNMTINSFHVNGLVPGRAYGSSTASGTIIIQGKTSNYASLNVIRLTMEKAKLHYRITGDDKEHVDQMFKEVSVSNAAVSSDYSGRGSQSKSMGSLAFTLTLKYNPIIFSYNINNTSIEVPTETISDSRDNAPGSDKQLFDGKADKPNGNNNNSSVSNTSDSKQNNGKVRITINGKRQNNNGTGTTGTADGAGTTGTVSGNNGNTTTHTSGTGAFSNEGNGSSTRGNANVSSTGGSTSSVLGDGGNRE